MANVRHRRLAAKSRVHNPNKQRCGYTTPTSVQTNDARKCCRWKDDGIKVGKISSVAAESTLAHTANRLACLAPRQYSTLHKRPPATLCVYLAVMWCAYELSVQSTRTISNRWCAEATTWHHRIGPILEQVHASSMAVSKKVVNANNDFITLCMLQGTISGFALAKEKARKMFTDQSICSRNTRIVQCHLWSAFCPIQSAMGTIYTSQATCVSHAATQKAKIESCNVPVPI
jgi:hypothetical protein